jgi:hypothetical protein
MRVNIRRTRGASPTLFHIPISNTLERLHGQMEHLIVENGRIDKKRKRG